MKNRRSLQWGTVLMCAPFIFVAIWKSPHLAFWVSSGTTPHVVQVIRLQDSTSARAGASQVNLNGVTLVLPDELIKNEFENVKGAGIVLRDGERRGVLVQGPTDNSTARYAFVESLDWLDKKIDRREVPVTSALYAASREQFRWCMNWNEVASLRSVLEHKRVVCTPTVYAVMVRQTRYWEGILLIEPTHASFAWYSMDGMTGGSIWFEKDSKHDDEWIKAACASFGLQAPPSKSNYSPD